jgi:hypothetical protein
MPDMSRPNGHDRHDALIVEHDTGRRGARLERAKQAVSVNDHGAVPIRYSRSPRTAEEQDVAIKILEFKTA